MSREGDELSCLTVTSIHFKNTRLKTAENNIWRTRDAVRTKNSGPSMKYIRVRYQNIINSKSQNNQLQRLVYCTLAKNRNVNYKAKVIN